MDPDHIADIAEFLREVLEDDTDETLCASLTIPDEETPWVQIIAGGLNIYWPFDEEDALGRLREAVPKLPDGVEIDDITANLNATFDVPELSVDDWAIVVDQLFQGLYGLPDDYDLDAQVSSLVLAIPEPVPIAREEGSHTDRIGTFGDGQQFLACVVATLPEEIPEDWGSVKRWYAVLHQFDAEGEHVSTDAEFTGTTADGEDDAIAKANAKLDEWVAALGDVQLGDIAINLFSIDVEGHEFGLLDTTYEEEIEGEEEGEIIVQATLMPNDLVFCEPWDGTYDT